MATLPRFWRTLFKIASNLAEQLIITRRCMVTLAVRQIATSIEFHALMGPPDTRTNCWLKWSDARIVVQSSDSLESQDLAASAKLISS